MDLYLNLVAYGITDKLYASDIEFCYIQPLLFRL